MGGGEMGGGGVSDYFYSETKSEIMGWGEWGGG